MENFPSFSILHFSFSIQFMFFAHQYFDLGKMPFPELFESDKPVWTVLEKIGAFLANRLRTKDTACEGANISPFAFVGANVWIGPGTVVEPGAVIKGPAWIGPNCQVRQGAYIRENVIVGADCVLGNSCEFKNCLLGEKAEVPHFNYVGDSVLGTQAHLGAGVILSNVRLDRKAVILSHEGRRHDTGLRKFGAIIGDSAGIGCNSVLSPGSIIGPRSVLYPGCLWRGVLGADQLVKVEQAQQIVPRRP